MKINYLLIGLLLFSIFGFAQDAGFSKKSMKENFSAETLQAYQESSFSKVNDFYEYAQLLTNTTISKELKKEIKTAVHSLFKENDVTVINFLSSEKEKITLNKETDVSKRIPSFEVNREIDATGITFAGIPSGHEFTSFVLALLQAGGHPLKLDAEKIEQIKNNIDAKKLNSDK